MCILKRQKNVPFLFVFLGVGVCFGVWLVLVWFCLGVVFFRRGGGEQGSTSQSSETHKVTNAHLNSLLSLACNSSSLIQ